MKVVAEINEECGIKGFEDGPSRYGLDMSTEKVIFLDIHF